MEHRTSKIKARGYVNMHLIISPSKRIFNQKYPQISIHEISTEELNKSAADLALKEKDDLNAIELSFEI